MGRRGISKVPAGPHEPKHTHTNTQRTSIYLWSEILNMFFLSFESGMRNKHWEIAVLKSHLLYFVVEPLRNSFPDSKRPLAQDVATANIIVLDHLGLSNYLLTRQRSEE